MTVAPLKLAALGLAAALAFPAPLMAGEENPTPDELIAITAALQRDGFRNWETVEYDDGEGVWEVDSAIGPDEQEVDVIVDPVTFAIIRLE